MKVDIGVLEQELQEDGVDVERSPYLPEEYLRVRDLQHSGNSESPFWVSQGPAADTRCTPAHQDAACHLLKACLACHR